MVKQPTPKNDGVFKSVGMMIIPEWTVIKFHGSKPPTSEHISFKSTYAGIVVCTKSYIQDPVTCDFSVKK